MTDHVRLHDPQRIRVLATLELEDPRLRADLDEIARRAAQRTAMPSGLISAVSGSTQTVIGAYGLTGLLATVGGSPAEWAFCTQVALIGAPYVVADAGTDAVQCNNPLVTMDGLASYAGVPITVDGQVVGAACLLGDTPRQFTDADLAELRTAAMDSVTVLQRYRS